MTKVFDAAASVERAASELATEVIMEAIEEICAEVHLSPLSAATVLLRANCQILAMMGGKHSKQYMQAMAEGPFISDRADIPRIDKKLRAAMELMARHFDLAINKPIGSA